MNSLFFFFNDTATTEIYTLSLHDALPISPRRDPDPGTREARSDVRVAGGARPWRVRRRRQRSLRQGSSARGREDRKSTRLNSSHGYISYAVFCLKKKKKQRK